MSKLGKFLSFLLTFLVLSFGAQARDGVPVIDHKDILISTTSGKPVSADQVRDAIIAGGNARGWEITKDANRDSLTATLNVRGKHSIAVSIPYSPEKFSIQYLNSVNMNYHMAGSGAAEGSTDLSKIGATPQVTPMGTPAPLIHPNYNRWVQGLLQAIQFELRKL